LWPKQIELAHRLRVGIPLQQAEAFGRIRDLIDFEALEDYLARFHCRVHEAYYHDALSAREEGRLVDAVLMTRLAIDHALDAYLAVRHQTNPQTKWRHRKLLRVAQGAGSLVEDYKHSLEVPPLDDAESVGRHVRRGLLLAENISICVQLNADYGMVVGRVG